MLKRAYTVAVQSVCWKLLGLALKYKIFFGRYPAGAASVSAARCLTAGGIASEQTGRATRLPAHPLSSGKCLGFLPTLKQREFKWPHKTGLHGTYLFMGCYVGSMLYLGCISIEKPLAEFMDHLRES